MPGIAGEESATSHAPASRRTKVRGRRDRQEESTVNFEKSQAVLPHEEVVDFVPDAVLIVDDNGTVARANRAAAALLGYERHSVEGRGVLDFLPSFDWNLTRLPSEPGTSGARRRLGSVPSPAPATAGPSPPISAPCGWTGMSGTRTSRTAPPWSSP
ncbi:PAS domain S-box protein [Streptomyces tanashiensis]|uniref:PAS domain S-box protein n=1 Tax=Streptomyces tanashiensis TaxID=67367 RepID=UPI0033ED5E02